MRDYKQDDRIELWTRRATPTYQPQSSMINIRQAERELKRKSLVNKISPFLIVAGSIGLGIYLSCNEPRGKPLEGFNQEAYNESIMPRQY